MRSDRKKVPLSEFITLQRGFDLPSKDRIDGTVPVVASTQITGWHNESKVEGPGVVIGRSGSIGGGQFISEDFWPLNTTLWVKNFKNHDPEFVYYLLRSIDFERLNVGSGVPTLNRNHLSSVEVPLFNEEEEVEIANQLGTLDKKIHLNQQTNETLEAIAKAVFKSWFVDFDPVRAKIEARSAGRDPNRAAMAAISACTKVSADGAVLWDETEAALDQKLVRMSDAQQQQLSNTAQLFPDELEESDIGEVPKGWEIDSIFNQAEYINGASFRGSDFSKSKTGLPVIKIAELKSGITEQTKFTEKEVKDKYHIDSGDVLFSWSGNPDSSIDIFIWDGGMGLLNQHIFKVESESKSRKVFNHYFLKSMLPFFKRTAANKQTTGLGHVTQKDLKRKEVAIPSKELINCFALTAEPIFDKVFSNLMETQHLSKLRDTLLPKLISGEVRV